jgi:hypothetical protein
MNLIKSKKYIVGFNTLQRKLLVIERKKCQISLKHMTIDDCKYDIIKGFDTLKEIWKFLYQSPSICKYLERNDCERGSLWFKNKKIMFTNSKGELELI